MEFDLRMMEMDPDTYHLTGDELRKMLERCDIDESTFATYIYVSKDQVEAWERDADAKIPGAADECAKYLYSMRFLCIGAITQALGEAFGVKFNALNFCNRKLFLPIVNEDQLSGSIDEWQIFRLYNSALKFVELGMVESGTTIEYVPFDQNYMQTISDKTRLNDYKFMLKWVGKSFEYFERANNPEEEDTQKPHRRKKKDKKRRVRLRRKR